MADIAKREEDQRTALEIAFEWASLPAEHLSVALSAMEPQLAREHEINLKRVELQIAKAKNAYRLRAWGLVAAFLLAAASFACTVILGLRHETWLAAVCSGPTLIVLVKTFTLRKSDVSDLREVGSILGKSTRSMDA